MPPFIPHAGGGLGGLGGLFHLASPEQISDVRYNVSPKNSRVDVSGEIHLIHLIHLDIITLLFDLTAGAAAKNQWPALARTLRARRMPWESRRRAPAFRLEEFTHPTPNRPRRPPERGD